LEIQEIFKVVCHRWRILVICTLLCVSTALAWFVAGPVEYTAQGRVLIATYGSLGTAVDAYSGERVAQLRAPTYAQLIQGPEVSTRAAEVLGDRFTPERIQAAVDARISAAMPMLVVTAKASTADDAVRILATVEQVFQQYVAQLEQPGRDGSLTGVTLTNDPPSVMRVGDPLTTAVMAGLCGLVAGTLLALYRDRTDQVIRNAGQIARAGLPYRGFISSPDGLLQARDDSFRRIAVQCASDSRRGVSENVLVVGIDDVSDVHSSRIAGGLAAGFAAYGRSVTLVLAHGDDRRQPENAEEPGLSNIIAGEFGWAECAQETEVKNLREVGRGSRHECIDALIMRRSLAGEAKIFQTGSDHTVVSGPSLVSSPDAIALAANVDSCLLIVTFRQSKLSELVEATHIVQALGVAVLGVVAIDQRRSVFRSGAVVPQLNSMKQHAGVTASVEPEVAVK
jgi:capsular polysaccharide biosynthesis protein